jgi:hypothetical protein
MGTGDQAGTWGATTNNNFQYIFEQAIAGLQTVSVTATPQALTYLNGATSTLANNQAIAAALIFTNGGVNANFTITTPSGSQKLYIVYNNTSYVATMQVTGSSGSTVAIPSQVTTTVYTDGTNFYAGSTGTIGSFGVNGALTVTGNAAVGGNETITGTLAVTGATTHTGAVALNGGGTSTTPTSTDNSTKIATTAFVQAVLPSSGTPLSAAAGGTGEAGTLTGVLYGNGTSAYTTATAAQIVSAIGTTAVTNATNATTATTASNVAGGYVSSINGSQGAVTMPSTQAWVNFNGYGSTTIRASYNVSSVTYFSGQGKYTVNFTNVLTDANYVPLFSAQFPVNANVGTYVVGPVAGPYAPTASACTIQNSNAGSGVFDTVGMFFAAIR